MLAFGAQVASMPGAALTNHAGEIFFTVRFLCASRSTPYVATPLLRDCSLTFHFPVDPPSFLVPYSPHGGVNSPDCSSDDSGAGFGGGGGGPADFLDRGCLDDADAFFTPLAPVPFLVAIYGS